MNVILWGANGAMGKLLSARLGSQVTGNMLAKELISAYLDCTYVYNERSGKKVDAIVEYENKH